MSGTLSIHWPRMELQSFATVYNSTFRHDASGHYSWLLIARSWGTAAVSVHNGVQALGSKVPTSTPPSMAVQLLCFNVHIL